MLIRPCSALAVLALSLLASCATQKAATREPNGISVAVAPDAKCDHRGAKATALPDAEVCTDVLAAFGKALSRAGFTVADHPGSGSLTLHVRATQDTESGESTALSIEVRVRRGEEEVDVVGGQADDLTAAGAGATIQGLLGTVANDLADSPRLKSSVASVH